jgi:hypothetical protein
MKMNFLSTEKFSSLKTVLQGEKALLQDSRKRKKSTTCSIQYFNDLSKNMHLIYLSAAERERGDMKTAFTTLIHTFLGSLSACAVFVLPQKQTFCQFSLYPSI